MNCTSRIVLTSLAACIGFAAGSVVGVALTGLGVVLWQERGRR